IDDELVAVNRAGDETRDRRRRDDVAVAASAAILVPVLPDDQVTLGYDRQVLGGLGHARVDHVGAAGAADRRFLGNDVLLDDLGIRVAFTWLASRRGLGLPLGAASTATPRPARPLRL